MAADPNLVRDFMRGVEHKILHGDVPTISKIFAIEVGILALILTIGALYEHFTVDRSD